MIKSEYSNLVILIVLGIQDINEDSLLAEIASIVEMTNMNDLEITYWSLLLDKYQWQDSTLNYKKFLKITAFQVKVNFYISL